MSDEGIIQFVSKILEDEEFKDDFYNDPRQALEGSGLDLTESEINELCKLEKKNQALNITLQKTPDGIHLGISHKPAPDYDKK